MSSTAAPSPATLTAPARSAATVEAVIAKTITGKIVAQFAQMRAATELLDVGSAMTSGLE